MHLAASTASACLSRYVVGCEYSLGLFMLLCIWLRVQLRLVYLAKRCIAGTALACFMSLCSSLRVQLRLVYLAQL